MSSFTIAAAALRAGLPESTLRYWERIGLVAPVARDQSSGHRRYSESDVLVLETLANLRAVGMSIEDMRTYFDDRGSTDVVASQRKALFAAHADRIRGEIVDMQTRLTYLDLKVAYWTALEAHDTERAASIADDLVRVIHQINPKEPTP
ncbi:hypothetical protein GCM10027568_32260 [Humibacter soli]